METNTHLDLDTLLESEKQKENNARDQQDIPTIQHEDRKEIEEHLIDNARKVLEIHYNHYNRIDQKAQRFLAFLGAVEGYFILTFVLDRKFNTTDVSSIVMIIALLVGIIVLGMYINILQSKPFYHGPNIAHQCDDFQPHGTIEETRKDTLATLKISYEENVKIINKKARVFKMSIRGLCIYFIIIVFYFGLLKMNENEIPSDILGIPNNEELLITDNLGGITTDENTIEEVEQGAIQEELEEEREEENTDELTPLIDTDKLSSENIGISEEENN
ncbi:MAG: hypothetical protein PHU61_02275 [Candidatus Absconditabacteria bacterium]|nr:hypothetical protein [Candidatus Absconditabacteria bacterium]MDD3868509.1 hypothetical protein [Candidatus Absconditabacteria bacterium]MDD4713895.1 hypothetical protein [Candidatus Absconditabacteria bacterium]